MLGRVLRPCAWTIPWRMKQPLHPRLEKSFQALMPFKGSIIHFSPWCLDSAVYCLAVQAFFYGISLGCCFFSFLLYALNTLQNILQPVQSIFLVFFPASKSLGFDHQHAAFWNPLVTETQKPLFYFIRQAGSMNVKFKVDRCGDFVDILAPCPLGPNGQKLNFCLGNAYDLSYF